MVVVTKITAVFAPVCPSTLCGVRSSFQAEAHEWLLGLCDFWAGGCIEIGRASCRERV
jgi:hypothetical protein